jgi:AcrR family transcriptional regulator
VTVADITARARVSRRTFYELFANRDECLEAAFESVIDLLAKELADLDLERLPWRERVRAGLWAILSFFDREPALARVCVVSALGGNPQVLERRRQILASLASVIDEGRFEGTRGAGCTELTAEGLIGAAFAIVHARLLGGERERERLTNLFGELMGMIVLPYLGPAAGRKEESRAAPQLPGFVAHAEAASQVREDPLDGVTMRLTYRTAKVLETVSEFQPVNNRQIAKHAGISDQGQVSKLLSRLERLGLLVNSSGGHPKGEPNAWSLTATGERVAHSIRMHACPARREVAA